MTVSELQVLRDAAFKNAIYSKKHFGDRSVEYTDAQKAVALYDAEIDKLNIASAGNKSRTTYACFRND